MPPSFVIIYDTITAGSEGARYARHLTHRFQSPAAPELHVWRADLLTIPAISAEALECAARADIVLLSLETSHLAVSALGWLEECMLRLAGRLGALVALIGSASADTGAALQLRARLRALSAETEIAFFCHHTIRHQNRRARAAAAATAGSRSQPETAEVVAEGWRSLANAVA